MTRSILKGAFAIASVCALSFLPTSCQSGGIGDPCIPEDEYNPAFGGFKVTEENIESRSFQCETRICLVNHFQGRVTCPFGQAKRPGCNPNAGAGACDAGSECKASSVYAPKCGDEGDPACVGDLVCNTDGKFCSCASDAQCATVGNEDGSYICSDGQCKQFVCHDGSCQTAEDTDPAAASKACCIPGTKDPVATSVCGQCDAGEDGGRDAKSAVYCSCRCGPPGESNEPPEGDNFNYCDCPDGFECKEVRPDLGIADPQLAGKYCIRAGTFTLPSEASGKCGQVNGNWSSDQCQGTPAL